MLAPRARKVCSLNVLSVRLISRPLSLSRVRSLPHLNLAIAVPLLLDPVRLRFWCAASFVLRVRSLLS
jgi:hypothetical protein